MKWYKKIIVWAALSLILQVGGLYVLDTFVFKHSSNFASKKIDLSAEKTAKVEAIIPNGGENISVSSNGNYLTYYLNGVLYLENAKTSESNKVTTEDEGTIIYSKWFSDRDRLIIVEKVKKDDEDVIQLVTYEPKKQVTTLVGEICTYEEGMEVKKISNSSLTGVYYIDIYKGGLRSVLYRIDINDDKTLVSLQSTVLGNMEVLPHKDRLIYEDTVNKKFYITSPDAELSFSSNKNLTLLGIDRQDVVYVGELNGEKVSSILYGSVDDKTSTWKSLALSSVVGRDEIYFNNNSEILINDNLKGVVKNLTTGAEVEYDGKLIQINEDFIVTIDNSNKISYKSLITS